MSRGDAILLNEQEKANLRLPGKRTGAESLHGS